jgi:transcriptional regulator with XRE-family HTH domain
MARKLTDQDIARGRRLAEIREALGLTQDAMVPRLNVAAEALGLAVRYKYYTVSRMEAGSLSFEDAAVWLSLDPERRGWEWFVFGADHKRRKPVPRPQTTAGASTRRQAG